MDLEEVMVQDGLRLLEGFRFVHQRALGWLFDVRSRRRPRPGSAEGGLWSTLDGRPNDI